MKETNVVTVRRFSETKPGDTFVYADRRNHSQDVYIRLPKDYIYLKLRQPKEYDKMASEDPEHDFCTCYNLSTNQLEKFSNDDAVTMVNVSLDIKFGDKD